MTDDGSIEDKCKRALLAIADDVRDINHKLSFFLESYRYDIYRTSNQDTNADGES